MDSHNSGISLKTIGFIAFIILTFFVVFSFCGSIDVKGGGSGSVSVRGGGSGIIAVGQETVVGDGYVGSTDFYGTSSGRVQNIVYFSSFTATASGHINYIHISIGEIGSTGVTAGIWTSGGTILAYANDGTTNIAAQYDWKNMQLNTEVTITSGTSYIIGYVTQDTSHRNSRDDDLTGSYRRSKAMTYATTLSDFDFTGATSLAENESFLYVCDNQADDPS